jgi:cyclase
LHSGADKVAVNTAAIKDPELITRVAGEFGSQCMVASIEAKNTGPGTWEAYYDNGREKTGLAVLDWAREVEKRGAGEILLTSVDREGTGRGMDVELITRVCDAVGIPVIASGGVGEIGHVRAVVEATRVSAVALAKVLHYGTASLDAIKGALRGLAGVEIR